jgi:Asp-tRNA(Asn)/Glu-tRNA(Gln) amidotransferase A subunit family amidase
MTAYNLKSLDLPRLSGRPLSFFVSALENRATRSTLLTRLLRDGGILALRAQVFPELPTLYPISPVESVAAEPDRPVDAMDRKLLEEQVLAEEESAFRTVADYALAYRSGQVTPEKIAERVLAAISESDAGPQPLRAFRAVDRADVMAQARTSAERHRAGKPLSLLDGVPVAVKDEVGQVPYPTTVGTPFLGRDPVAKDATIVARLRAAGALLIGKTNMNELGLNPDGFNCHFGTVRNPYDLNHHPGGSSSGSGAAVAAGLCPVAIGADGGGSIRIPASLCGVVGLKGTFSRISEHGAVPLTQTMGHLGPIGATVADVALVYATIAGPDEKDPLTLHRPPLTLENWQAADLKGLTLGIYRSWFDHAAPEIVAANQRMVEWLQEAGANFKEIEIPYLDEMRIAHAVTILVEIAANMEVHAERWKACGAPTRVNLLLGRAATAHDYLQALRVRTRGLAIFRAVFDEVDALVTPATALMAPPIPANGSLWGWSDLNTVTELMRYVFPGNLLGLPAIAFPVGYGSGGLPIGMQAMGPHWSEHHLLRIARVAERLVERRRPSLYFDILGDQADYCHL